jgi:hypothetical protein
MFCIYKKSFIISGVQIWLGLLRLLANSRDEVSLVRYEVHQCVGMFLNLALKIIQVDTVGAYISSNKPPPLLEGAAGRVQRGRHCYTILLSENAILALGLRLKIF